MQWIKAKDRMPTEIKVYCTREPNWNNDDFIRHSGVPSKDWLETNTEWLDESPKTEQGIEAVFGELLNAAEMALTYLEFPSNEITRADYDQLKSAIQKAKSV